MTHRVIDGPIYQLAEVGVPAGVMDQIQEIEAEMAPLAKKMQESRTEKK